MFTQLMEQPELTVAAHPIFDQLYAEMAADIGASEQLLDEVRIGEFEYFDDTDWDEWTQLTVPMPISHAIGRLVALTTDTQLMHIVHPATQDQMAQGQ